MKLTAAVNEHAMEIGEEIGGAGHGIPYHAMMSPGGQVLISSEGPLGNIGMPTSVEGIRHFEKMMKAVANRMTEGEIASLIDSLREP